MIVDSITAQQHHVQHIIKMFSCEYIIKNIANEQAHEIKCHLHSTSQMFLSATRKYGIALLPLKYFQPYCSPKLYVV